MVRPDELIAVGEAVASSDCFCSQIGAVGGVHLTFDVVAVQRFFAGQL